jgi:hypothetical protein
VANHLTKIPGWMKTTLACDTWELCPTNVEPDESPQLSTTKKILELIDANVAESRKSLAASAHKEFQKRWSLAPAGESLIPKPGGMRM